MKMKCRIRLCVEVLKGVNIFYDIIFYTKLEHKIKLKEKRLE